MNRRIALALLAAAVCSAAPGLAQNLDPAYLELYGGTWSLDCADPDADRIEDGDAARHYLCSPAE